MVPRSFATSPRIVATQWPEADTLFRSDPRWLGSDDGYSVELAPGRILWLFGDTFVGDGIDASRSRAAFIHNSIGIQHGPDPASASIAFHWKSGPDAFFPAPECTWYWPLHGALVPGGRLLLFMMLVRSPVGGDGTFDEWRRLGSLGFFEVFGWAAVSVSNPQDDPSDWDVDLIAEHHDDIVLGASVVVESDHVYAFGWDSGRRVFLARWPIETAPDAQPEWWTGSDWGRDAQPAVVIKKGATEFTVHRDGMWYQTQMLDGRLVVRRAEQLQGPWSEPEPIMTPEEALRPEVFLYAGKAHPHLAGADLVLTYASIAEADATLNDDSIYYPRFGRAALKSR